MKTLEHDVIDQGKFSLLLLFFVNNSKRLKPLKFSVISVRLCNGVCFVKKNGCLLDRRDGVIERVSFELSMPTSGVVRFATKF